nr:hypothetical protein [Tanacetum cinerariifolium]
MSKRRGIKTRLRRREVKQSGKFNIMFKIVDEYWVKVNKMKGDDDEMMAMMRREVVWCCVGDDDGDEDIYGNGGSGKEMEMV